MREEDLVQPDEIRFPNAMEEAANKYWRASMIWRDRIESTWNYQNMIDELRGTFKYRGLASLLAERLLGDVIKGDREAAAAAADQIPLPVNINE